MYEMVTEGQVLAGKYRVERVLGEGGMGVVVAARHLQLDERVALKFMRLETLLNAEAVARFSREARAAVKIKSEHVARVSDVGTLENGAPYMVMEYLEGVDLSAWLKQQGRLPVEQAVEFVLQASEAIAEAHALGIVHRDLKPANLFVVRRPDGAWSVKVLDFGISKMTSLSGSGSDHGMTKTSALMGSPNYMSPEQMRSVRDVDARSDIWAVGVVLYELVTGVTPFTAESFPELVLKIASEAPAPLRNALPSAPAALEALILRCLEKDPGKRFATVGDLAVALVEFAPRRGKLSLERISGVLRAAGLSQSAVALPPSSDGAAADPGTAASWGQTASGRASNHRALLTGGAVLAVAALGLAGYALRESGPKAAPTAEAIPASAGALPSPAAPPVTEVAAPAPAELAVPAPAASEPVSTSNAPAPSPHKSPSRAGGTTRKLAPTNPSPAPPSAPTAATSSAPAAPTTKPKPPPKSTANVFDER